ncbi:TPA: hypothetical protein N0F65_011575 [Lagenidium giganteum]|uniref:Polyprotein n=1 Tax=Lagenidium giganteum TaxID=4803 RepID=A0AAV2YNT2_9STRA|nr:TPA: hypothetical protein N0F65_011575 [Lagenidium giganteum]
MNNSNKRKREEDHNNAGAAQAHDGEEEEKVDTDPPSAVPRRSGRTRIEPIEWWKASANAVEVADAAEPQTFQQAINSPDAVHWRKAINEELKSLRVRGVYLVAK